MIPKHSSGQLQYAQDSFQIETLMDFTGGLNLTDPEVSLPKNQYSVFQNFIFNRDGSVRVRPPYRPYYFQANPADRHIEVDISGRYHLNTVLDYQIFRENITNWSYDNELHVVTGSFVDDNGANAKTVVAAYCNVVDDWIAIWNDANASDVSVCPYKINEAFDLLIFPNDVTNTGPQRWSPDSTADYYTLSDLGLATPGVAEFTVVHTEGNNSDGFTRAKADTVYYKFSYFYDDSGSTTKYGESAASAVTVTSSEVLAVTTDKGQISMAIADSVGGAGTGIPTGVTKIKVYRAPLNTVEGPYKYIGETDVSGADDDGGGTIDTFVDSTEWGEEGAEDLLSGSNPSLSGSEIPMENVRTIGPYLVGFNANMPYKLIWSDSGYPDVWIPTNYDYLDDTGQRAIEFNRKVYAFTKTAVYEKASMADEAIKICNIGCLDGKSVQDVGNGLIWMDYDSVYFADFVQQYGSKGDFPKDIGHEISKSIKRYYSTDLINSVFFDRRYYLSFTDTDGYVIQNYCYDIDIGAWTELSHRHYAFSRGDTAMFSLGKSNDQFWVYEHGYDATVSIETGFSDYEGKDYHDWESISESFWDLINEATTLAWWKCNDKLATQAVLDALEHKTGGGSHDGTTGARNTTTISGASGQIDRCFDFRTTQDYIDITDHADFNFAGEAFSVSAWIYIDSGVAPGADDIILSKYTAANEEWLFGVDADEKLFLRIFDDSSGDYVQALTDAALTTDTWVHVVGTYDGATGASAEAGINLYVDNVAVAITQSDSGTFDSIENLGDNIQIGGHSDANSWVGQLDSIILFNKELSATEVGYVYNYPRNTGMLNIPAVIERGNIKLDGEYRKVFISSMSMIVEAVNLNMDVTFTGDDDRFSVTKNFSSALGVGSVVTYPAVFDDSVFAAGSPGAGSEADGDATEAGYAGFEEGKGTLHKKIHRSMKTEDLRIQLSTTDARDLQLLLLAIYYKALPTVA